MSCAVPLMYLKVGHKDRSQIPGPWDTHFPIAAGIQHIEFRHTRIQERKACSGSYFEGYRGREVVQREHEAAGHSTSIQSGSRER